MSNDTPQARGADESSEPAEADRTPAEFGGEEAAGDEPLARDEAVARDEPVTEEPVEAPAAAAPAAHAAEEAPVAHSAEASPAEETTAYEPVRAREPYVGEDTAAFDVVPDQHDTARVDAPAEPVILPPEPSGETSAYPGGAAEQVPAAAPEPVPAGAPEQVPEAAPEPVAYEDTASAEQAGTTGLEGGIAAATVAAPTPMYVTAPTAPKRRGNRLMGILIDIVATIAFAVLFALVTLALIAVGGQKGSMVTWEHFLQTAGFWLPVVVFFLAEALLIAIVNRAGWWAHVLGSFFVGVVVYFAYMGGTLFSVDVMHMSASFAGQFLRTIAVSPAAIFAGVIARETSLWFGAWIAARGRRVRAANLEAQREYDRRIAAGPTTNPGA